MAVTQVPISGANTLVGFTITLPFTVNDQFSFSFPYLDQADFKIEVASTTVLDTADYEFVSDYLIQLTQIGVDKLNALYVAPLTEVDLVLSRSTTLSNRLVDFQDGANLTEEELDLNSNQAFYLLQEAYDTFLTGSLTLNPVTGVINAKNSEIINVAESGTLTSAATLNTVLDNVTTPDYEEFAVYRTGKLVFIGDNIYRAIVDIDSAPATPDLGDFELVIDVAALAAAAAVFDDVAANTAAITVNSDNLTAHEAEQDAHQEIDTEANLVTWAASANNGDHAYATDTKKYYGVEDGELTEFGGGGGGSQSTALISGGSVTINADPTKIDIAPLTGVVVDAYTDPTAAPVVTDVVYAGGTVTVPKLTTQAVQWVFMDSTGTVSFMDVPDDVLISEELKDKFFLAATFHNQVTGEVAAINDTTITPTTSYGHNITDLSLAVGIINTKGNVFGAASNNMTISKSAGSTFRIGQNFKNSYKDPNEVASAMMNPASFFYVFRDGAGGYEVVPPTTNIVANAYDDGTVTSGSPNGSVSNNRWSVQRIYLVANSAVYIHYGQKTYASLTEAIDGMGTEVFDANPALATTLFRGFLIVKGNTTDLSNTSNALFVAADKFGSTGVSGGATNAITNLQQAYNNSVDPELVMSTNVGALSVNQGNLTTGDTIFEVENTAGDTKLLDVSGYGTSVTDRDGTTVIKEESDILHRETFKLNAPSSLYTITGVSTVTNETASPISGYQSAKFTQVAGSQDDLITLTDGIPLSRKALSQTVALLMDVTYSGNDSDIKVKILQSDDDITYDEVAYALLGNTSEVSKMGLATDFRDTATHFKYEFEVISETIGAVLEFDDVRLSSDPFSKVSTVSKPVVVRARGNSGASITADTERIDFTIVEDTHNTWIQNDSNGSDTFKVPREGSYLFTGNISQTTNSVNVIKVYKNNVYHALINDQRTFTAADNLLFSYSEKLQKGDEIDFRFNDTVTLDNTSVDHHLTITELFPLVNESVIVESSDSVMSEWTSYTPTFTGLGTVTDIEAYYRRVGDTMEIRGISVTGTTSATPGKISLPSGYFIDANKMDVTFYNIVGVYASAFTSTTRSSFNVVSRGDTIDAAFLTARDGSSGGVNPVNANTIIADSQELTFFFSVPIAGWSATPKPLLALPTITYGGEPEVARFDTRGDADGFASSNTAIFYFANEHQNTVSNLGMIANSSSDGWSFTATRRCKVDISLTIGYTASGWIGLSKNSSQLTTSIQSITGSDIVSANFAASNNIVTFSGILEAGDVIRPHGQTGLTVDSQDNQAILSLKVEPIQGVTNQAAIIAQPVAFVEDQKPSGTSGGTSTTAPTARDLNTLSGDIAAVGVVLDGTDGFKLTEGGKFKIEWSAPAHDPTRHKTALFNETISESVKSGTSEYQSNVEQTRSFGHWVGNVQANTVFSILHEVEVSKSGDGFGIEAGNYLTIDQDGASNELYTKVTITRMK